MGRGRPKGRRRETSGTGTGRHGPSDLNTSEEDSVDFDPDKLWIVMEGQRKAFSVWTKEYARYYYPDLGRKTYRVPPVDFNTQPLTDNRRLGFAELGTPKEEDRKKNRSQADVGFMFEELGKRLEKSADDGRGLFIVANAQYENYLSDLKWVKMKGKQPPLPQEVVSRGELDFLILHPIVGIMLVQVKGVGFVDSWKPSEEQLQKAVLKKVTEAQAQLKRDNIVLHHVMKDLHLKCAVHRVVALPFVTRDFLQASLQGGAKDTTDNGEIRPYFLCSDDMSSSDALFTWWTGLTVDDHCTELEDSQLQSIVGRYCGLLSTVSVWCKSSLRVEVRDVAEAADEVGARFAHLVLTTQQRNALDCQSRQVFLHGPPGTGKSVMMIVKARQWLLGGEDVCVLNLDFGRVGNPVGYYIHDGIVQWLLKTFDKESEEKKSSSPRKKAKVITDKAEVNIISANNDGKLSTDHQSSVTEDKPEPANGITQNPNVCVSERVSQPLALLKESSNETDVCSTDTEICSSELEASVSSSFSSSSDVESSRTDGLGRVFRIDLDMGMNSDGEQVKVKTEKLLSQIQQNVRPGVPCHFIWDEFYWKDRLAPVTDALRSRFPNSCIWCAEVSHEKISEHFTTIMLTTVLRCPPTVQGLLKQLDWLEDNRAFYAVDSTVHGLPTDGFKPKLLEHKSHQAASPLDCVDCADLLLSFFHEDLKLAFGDSSEVAEQLKSNEAAADPEISHTTPGAALQTPACTSSGSTSNGDFEANGQCQKDSSKSLPIPKGKKKRNQCLLCRVKFSDIVVLFAYPRKCLSRAANLLIVKDKPQDIHHSNIENSVLFRRMKDAGLPVIFRAPNVDAQEIALPTEDKILFSVTNAVTGLERKVVVYVPCESTVYEYPVERNHGKSLEATMPIEISASCAETKASQSSDILPGTELCETEDGSVPCNSDSDGVGKTQCLPPDTLDTKTCENQEKISAVSDTDHDIHTEAPTCTASSFSYSTVKAPSNGSNTAIDTAVDVNAAAELVLNKDGLIPDNGKADETGYNQYLLSQASDVNQVNTTTLSRHCSKRQYHDPPGDEESVDEESACGTRQTKFLHNECAQQAKRGCAIGNHNPKDANWSTGTKHGTKSKGVAPLQCDMSACNERKTVYNADSGHQIDMSENKPFSEIQLTVSIPGESRENNDNGPEQNSKTGDETQDVTLTIKQSDNHQETSPEASNVVSDWFPSASGGSEKVSSFMEQTDGVTTGLSEEDWEKIHDRMLEQNQKGMFYAASRCLSVFVLIIP